MTNPTWPEQGVDTLVFILDATTKIEVAMMEEFISHTLAPTCPHTSVVLPLRANRSAQTGTAQLDNFIDHNSAVYFLPMRVVWGTQSSQTPSDTVSASVMDWLLRRTVSPGIMRQRLLWRSARKDPSSADFRVVTGEGASLAELNQRFEKKSLPGALPDYIARSALLTLERREREIRGTRYKVPRLVDTEVLGKPQMVNALKTLSAETGKPLEDLQREAAACLKEMAATPTPGGVGLAAALGRFMYTRGFDPEIQFAEGDLERVRKILGERPVAFLFTHKSHVDGFLLISLFHDLNFPPAHTFGGINMGFMGLGTLLRHAGAIFIRRSFGDDNVYKEVFKNYIDYLGEKRFPLMWALEGTRSRTGKLMPPRYGLINYVVSAYLRDEAPDLLLMPITIVYDQIPEISDYDHIQAGGQKRPESASWFMQYLSGLKNPHGKIHVRFGQGIQISDYIDMNAGLTKVDRRALQKMAFDLAVDVNKVTPITVNSLITYVLLEQGHRALTIAEIERELDDLLAFIRRFDFAMTKNAKNLGKEGIRQALGQLSATGAIQVADEGAETVYLIPHGLARTAAYYRNGLIHFFITSAIGEVAVLAVSETGENALQQFRQEALKIRDLLKYEFFFEGSDEFIEVLENQFSHRFGEQWREIVAQGKTVIVDRLTHTNFLIGHGTLRPFLEAYLLFARCLSSLPTDKPVDAKRLIADSLALGKQVVLQQRIHCEESVSQAYFENALQIAEGRGLLEQTPEAIAGRKTLLLELRRIVGNVQFLASIKEARRLHERLASQAI